MSASTTPTLTPTFNRIAKGVNGWAGKTQFDMGTKDKEGRDCLLVISTHKTQGGIVSTYTVMKDEGNGGMSCMLFRDYSARVMHRGARCTEKTVRELHDEAICLSGAHLTLAAEFYAAKALKDAKLDAQEAAHTPSTELGGFSDPMHY